MNILITGASGFVGTALCRFLLNKGEEVTGVGRSNQHLLNSGTFFNDHPALKDKFRWVSADTEHSGDWQEHVARADVIVNLTGKNIFGYWTENYKKQIYTSRVKTTENIVAALPDKSSATLLNTSAIGYYGDRGDVSLTEKDEPGNDFLAKVCVDWEKSALKGAEKGARVVLMRFGVVLGKNGGALGKMLPAFKFFAGGPLGKGLHWFPWIHMDDLLCAILFCIETQKIEGAVNFVSPDPLRHKEFASALGHALNRPSLMPAPAFMIKAIMGEMGHAFLSSQRATPSVLSDNGFKFRFSDIDMALTDLV
ncbi:NAD-dependent epimerase/dehydratase [Desulfamplus magnetovallimortis]|uniref:NAD-dependent epimerase/dehydratase n=1 Tax=Desulfamplus magnetovallimortis TaxID=1246637 RepID=A0A1W1H5J8_9BACT|nr:TIGR01777 family oxidoreductase [Desulfamplus magnetovallimortis]SLM27638.1 NAD-dependent epimerase/dehydratase [Desulfamplus magnetovallimortis]